MSNSTWNGWFGDGSLAYMTSIGKTSRFTIRRRFIVFLAAIGATHGFGTTATWAEEGSVEIKAYQAPIIWSPSSSFAMMLAADGPDTDQKKSNMLQNTPTDESLIEDEAPLSPREVMSDTDDIANELSDRPPLSSAGDRNADGNRNANTEYFIKPKYPSINQGRFVLPPLRAVSIAQNSIGSGQVPKTVSAGDELNRIALPEDGNQRVAYSGEGYWPELIRPWAAPNTFSHPLYFEDRMLERHGQERWGCLQPLASGTRFFVTLPMLPYLSTVQPPCDFVYSKGYYRVGSPVPKFFQRPPLERRAIIVEAATVSGAFIALP